MNALKNLFLDELADRYDAERRLVRAMPKLVKAATNKDLQRLIQAHLKETIGHVKKLETVFKAFDVKVKAKKCHATIGLLKESADILSDFKRSPAINAAIISLAQKVEHYEITSYGCLREWATLLGQREAGLLLNEILSEEKSANKALIALARSSSNTEALGIIGMAKHSSDGKAEKPLKTRHGIRALFLHSTRPSTL